MSEHDQIPDPIDQAYVRAEAVLNDEGERAARRARVLAAVAQEATPVPAPAVGRRQAWPWAGVAAAASVAGLSLFLVLQTYHTPATPGAPTPNAPAAAPEAGSEAAGPQAPVAPTPTSKAAPAPSSAGSAGAVAPTAAPARANADLAPPPAVIQASPAPQNPPTAVAPAPAPPPPPPPAPVAAMAAPPASVTTVIGTGTNIAGAKAVGSPIQRLSREDILRSGSTSLRDTLSALPPVALPPDAPTRLRAAAAAGRTAEIETLLTEGVAVDAPDADGNTALMLSIRSNRPAAATLLRARGASLDTRNKAGQSAGDMAKTLGDAGMNQALGLPLAP